MNGIYEDIGIISDELESLQAALDIPMPAEFHIAQIRELLPEKIKALREALVKLSGENPWEGSEPYQSAPVKKINTEITQINAGVLTQIEELAAVNYSYAEMAIYLNMPKKLFMQEAKQKDTAVWTAINRGRLKTQFDIDNKLAENATSGNITAVQIYEKRTKTKDFENLKDMVYGI